MYDDGFHAITNIDFSEVVIEEMKKKNVKRSEMSFLLMDMLNMSFENETFDVVLDKGILTTLISKT
jgi:ubiquinone/menaquinone biosynthesis C-methylase UbiE